MLLSEILRCIEQPYELIRDSSFDFPEQCTRIRASSALTYIDRVKFLPYLEQKGISCVICTPELKDSLPTHIKGVVTAENPKGVFFEVHNLLVEKSAKKATVIDKTAVICPGAVISPYNVEIGPDVVVGANAVIEENSILERGVRIGANSTVGCQNFDVIQHGDTLFMAKNGGWVRMREYSEIGSGTQIEGATLMKDVTDIGQYVKIDNSVVIGHGSSIGTRTLIAGMSVISGNVTIAADVFIGVGVTISNRIRIGDHARVSLGSVVTKDVPDGQTVTGNFAIDHAKFMQNLKALAASQTDGADRPIKKDNTEE